MMGLKDLNPGHLAVQAEGHNYVKVDGGSYAPAAIRVP